MSYQWSRDGSPIDGATADNYTLTQDDVGAEITVTASYTDGEGTLESVTSAATSPVANVNNDLPTGGVTITGVTTEGEVLTADTSTLDDANGLGTLNYQWSRDGSPIDGATADTYTLTQDDVGAVITVTASYIDGGGTTESVTSAATSPVTDVNNDLPTGGVTITGVATEGEILNTDTSTLDDANGLGALNYQWSRDGSPIDGATSDNYTLTQDDVGAVITVTVNYTDGGGTPESVTSPGTSAVTNDNAAPTGSVTISGPEIEGQQLVVSHNLADADGLGLFSRQWSRDGSPIDGAISSIYTLTQEDVGAVITVTVSYTDGGGTLESETSPATGVIENVEHLPTLNPIHNVTMVENSPVQLIRLAGITDGDGGTQGVRVTSSINTPSPIANPVMFEYPELGEDRLLSLVTLPDQYGTTSITVTVEDGGPDGDLDSIDDNSTFSQVFDVAITPLTDDQSAVPPISEMFIHETLSGDPASSYQLPVVNVNGHAIKGLLHRIVATSSDPSIIPDPSVAYSSTDVPSQISFAPVNDAHGIATISVQVEDGGLDNNFETTEDNRQFTYQYEVNVLEIISKGSAVLAKDSSENLYADTQPVLYNMQQAPTNFMAGFAALGATTDGNEKRFAYAEIWSNESGNY